MIRFKSILKFTFSVVWLLVVLVRPLFLLSNYLFLDGLNYYDATTTQSSTTSTSPSAFSDVAWHYVPTTTSTFHHVVSSVINSTSSTTSFSTSLSYASSANSWSSYFSFPSWLRPTTTKNDISNWDSNDGGTPPPFGFSACLLLRDDNKILPEWLAYHAQILPLTRLIVAIDPFSVTDPTPIFEAYQNELNINITIWRDVDYMRNGTARRTWERSFAHPAATPEERYKGYLWRQRVLLMECTKQLQKENRTWTMFLDTDEYLTYNYYHPNEGRAYDCTGKVPYHVVRQSEGLYQELRNRLPAIGTPNSTIAHFLSSDVVQQDLYALDRSQNVSQYTQTSSENFCWVLPRYTFGAWDIDTSYHNASTPHINATDTEWPRLQQHGFNVSLFRSLRFRKTRYMPFGGLESPGKPILDVSRVPKGRWDIGNPHRPHRMCHPGIAFVSHYNNVLRVNHYSGTIEEFMTRRNGQLYQFYDPNNATNILHDEHHNEIIPWLSAFVKRVGVDRAYQLTEGLREWAWNNDAQVFGRFQMLSPNLNG